MHIKIQSGAFDGQSEITALFGDRVDIGALVSFTGFVRGDDDLKSMTLEHYPSMVEVALQDIADEAQKRWKIEDGLIIHRFGKLYPRDPIVFVGVLSAHREDAFEAARFLMDWLKTKAPFWKLEEKKTGCVWVEAKEEDAVLSKRWET